MSDDDKNSSSVRVAVRIRPQIPREIIDMCRICTFVTPGEPQVVLGTDKAFTFDYVFDTTSDQVSIYSDCVEKLVNGALKGYNATVLAYGQTGSGKTYTIGTGFDRDLTECQEGIIPRAIRHLFSGIEAMQANPYDEDGTYLGSVQFSVAAQFMELYNEEIIDLLDPYGKGKIFKIHEDTYGSISVAGATIKPLKGPQDALNCLQQGAIARTTASTNMNEMSSRSHAIFTILIRRQRVMSSENCPEDDLETLTSKFHFVDLAGSERLKRTGATGERAREGISINCGLLALGNVISALGDVTKRALHVPYRDSKLTRLLQDSLGGNSQTIMIACISPSDRDFMETLNTLKYANRARNIKNRVQLNQDQSSRTISQLRREIAALQLELLEYKSGKRQIDEEGNAAVSDTSLENAMLLADNKRLQQRIKAMQETINALTDRNTQLLAEQATHGWGGDDGDRSMTEMIANYIAEIEKLKAKLIESEQMFQQLKKSQTNPPRNALKQSTYLDEITENPSNLINLAKRELEREREILMSKSLPGMPDNAAQESQNEKSSSAENESDSDSDTESDDKAIELQAEINDIQSDIEIKTKLIEQLELSQQRMTIMKEHYEAKLNVLSAKIANTQKERDQVLANMGRSDAGDQTGRVKKVRDEYERKLSDMQKELKRLQQAQKEHIRQQRELQAQDNQLKSLRQELTDLKQIKIKLMRKMTDDNTRHKEEDAKRVREIAQLRKEARKQSNMIKSLQGSVAAKDQVLKRKTEEVSALRKTQKNSLSTKAQGRVAVSQKKENSTFHPRQARIKWESLQRTIGKSARSKQAVIELERELERLLQERDQLSKDLAGVKRRQKFQDTPELASEEDGIQANLNYIQENIEQVQNSIMELEEGKESAHEQLALQNILESLRSVDEAKFLIEKLCTNSIIQACDVGLAHTRLKEKETLLTEVQQDSNIQQQLLQHVLARNPAIALSEVTIASSSNGTNERNLNDASTHSSRSPSPINSEISDIQARKVRRRVAPMAQELLFGDLANGNDDMSRSYTIQDATGNATTKNSLIPLARVPSAPGSLKDHPKSPSNAPLLSRQKSAITASPMFSRKFDVSTPATAPQSPRMIRRQLSNKASPGLEENEFIPTPASPIVYRRNISREDGDVFSRLGAGQLDPTPGGSIKDFSGKMKVGSPLICTHIVDGHNSQVLAIKASDTTLFTAAADRTCKIWDLRQASTIHCLSAHPGPVVSVEYDKMSKVLFSASGAFIRAWDLRESNIRPIKTLCSSGVALSGAASLTSIPTGESPITALKMGTMSGNLYTAASDSKVRIWDMRMFSCIGKLAGAHQAAIMCITTWDGPNNMDYVATGSKDHYLKVFEVPSTAGNVMPLLNLEPPHYDGVQALVVSPGSLGVDGELFSGSRDTCIKRWNLRNSELKQSLNNAHKGWVSGMTIYSDILMSTCRGGLIRLWSLTCDALAEMKTEASINDITSASNRIFTASNDGKVRVYRLSSAIRRLSQESR